MKSMNTFMMALLTVLFFVATSCQKDEIADNTRVTDVSGVVQKGPFNVGTTVTLSELDETLTQTGKTFITEIKNDNGEFGLEGIELASPFVEMKADGFYFDEIAGKNSAARLTLNAIADINDKSTININVLTHLEKPRIVYLISTGYSFSEAKLKAQQEVLDIFNLPADGLGNSESLNIINPGPGNAVLLALSAVIQGYRPVADVSGLLTRIANDLKEDGTLNDAELKSALISHAIYIDPEKTVQNLEVRYANEGTPVNIPEFGLYLNQFIENTDFMMEALIQYPAESSFGINILNQNNSVFETGYNTNYSMAAETIAGIGLKIELSIIEAEEHAAWGIQVGQINWRVSNTDPITRTRTFEVVETGKPADLKISFARSMKFQIKYIEGTIEWTRVVEAL